MDKKPDPMSREGLRIRLRRRNREIQALTAQNKALRLFFDAYMELVGEHLQGCNGGEGDCKCKINELIGRDS